MRQLTDNCRDKPYHQLVYRVRPWFQDGDILYIEYLQCVYCYHVFNIEETNSCPAS